MTSTINPALPDLDQYRRTAERTQLDYLQAQVRVLAAAIRKEHPAVRILEFDHRETVGEIVPWLAQVYVDHGVPADEDVADAIRNDYLSAWDLDRAFGDMVNGRMLDLDEDLTAHTPDRSIWTTTVDGKNGLSVCVWPSEAAALEGLLAYAEYPDMTHDRVIDHLRDDLGLSVDVSDHVVPDGV